MPLVYAEYRRSGDLFQISDSFVNVRVDRVVRLGKIAWIEKALTHVFRIVFPDRACENGQQIIDAHFGRLHQLCIVQRRVQVSRMDMSPTVAEPVRVITFDMETLFGIVLQN